MYKKLGLAVLCSVVAMLVYLEFRESPPASDLTRRKFAGETIPTLLSSPLVPVVQKDSVITPAPIIQTAPDTRKVAASICETGILQKIRPSRFSEDGRCESLLSDFPKIVHGESVYLARNGVEVDHTTCTARDQAGNQVNLSNFMGEITDLTRHTLAHTLGFEYEYGDRARLLLLQGVAICSIAKSLEYWSRHPAEMPPGDEIFASLFFDLRAQRPERSPLVEALLKAMVAVSQ